MANFKWKIIFKIFMIILSKKKNYMVIKLTFRKLNFPYKSLRWVNQYIKKKLIKLGWFFSIVYSFKNC